MPTFPLERFNRTQAEIERAKTLHRILAESTDAVMPERGVKQREPGDPWKLRGIPAVGVRGGVGGAIPGTKPGANLK